MDSCHLGEFSFKLWGFPLFVAVPPQSSAKLKSHLTSGWSANESPSMRPEWDEKVKFFGVRKPDKSIRTSRVQVSDQPVPLEDYTS